MPVETNYARFQYPNRNLVEGHEVPSTPQNYFGGFMSLCVDRPRVAVPAPPQPVAGRNSLQEDVISGLRIYTPVPTKTGVNGSFILKDFQGKKCAIFKPMGMEAGKAKNHRLDAAHNVQFRKSILPGQGAGNEVLAYALDRNAFGYHYGIPKTVLMRLEHPAFEGSDLGSVQHYVHNTRPLSQMNSYECSLIPKEQWEKLNFRLISGSTDAHLGNILYSDETQQIYLIDSGDDFIGESGQSQYYNPWVLQPACQVQMSEKEYHFLGQIDVWKTIAVFEQQALANEREHPLLKVTDDKYRLQILRLFLAKAAAKFRLTQAEWFEVMTPHYIQGRHYPGVLESIYNQHVRPYRQNQISWFHVQRAVDTAAYEQWLKRA